MLRKELDFWAGKGELNEYLADRPSQLQRPNLPPPPPRHQERQPSQGYRGRDRGNYGRPNNANQEQRPRYDPPRRIEPPAQAEDAPPARGRINMINDGRQGGEISKKRKRQAHEIMKVDQRPSKRHEEPSWKSKPIVFTDEDLVGICGPQCEALVAEVRIGDYDVTKVLFDTGSGPNVLYHHAYKKMQINPALLRPHKRRVFGFNNVPIGVEGVVALPVRVGHGRNSLTEVLDFLIVRVKSTYNAILGRPFLSAIRGIVSQPHLCIKFPTPRGIGIIRGDQQMAEECYFVAYKAQGDGSFLEKYQQEEEEESDNDPETSQKMGYEDDEEGSMIV